jgi:hypothetical protein
LSGCATPDSRPPVVVAPPLEHYSPIFQAQLAGEIETDPRQPCDRIDPAPSCSAWKRVVIDHGDLRRMIRETVRR